MIVDTYRSEHGVDYQVRQVTAYISVYEVSRCYGGPEEGGWWYDSYEWLRVSIPFRALQDYRFDELDEDERSLEYQVAASAEHDWRPCGPPRPADFPSQVFMDSTYMHLMSIYGDEGDRDRYSVIGGPDIEFVIERNPGERGEMPRPRYE